MKLFKLFSNKRLFILLITLVVFIVLMGFSLGQRKSLSWPENFLRDTVGFVQKLFYKPAGYVAGLFEDIGNLNELAEENEQLKIAVAQFARERSEYNMIKADYERYKKLLNFTKEQAGRYEAVLKVGQVISLSNDPNNMTLVIDQGSKNGIRPNLAVITDEGLVGVISQVSNFTSTVKLMTMMDANDPNSQPPISATVLNKEDKSFGVIESYDPKTKMLKMNRIPPNDPIAEGDIIVSSGEGGVYPRALQIGTVKSVGPGDMGKTRTAIVEPFAKFQDWKELIVVVTNEPLEAPAGADGTEAAQ